MPASRSRSRSGVRTRSPAPTRARSRSPAPVRARSRSPAPARARSRSPAPARARSRSPVARRSRTRSRSGSRGGADRRGGGGRGKDHSRSPMSNRRRHDGNRENPDKSKCIGVFGLSLYTTERELEKEFGKFGPIERTQVVLDGHSGRSRGFAFIYYEQMDDASEAREALNGVELDGRKIRVDFSITKRAHTPTPGMYMGRPTHSKEDRRGPPSRGGGGGGGYRDERRGGGGDYREERGGRRDDYRRRSRSPQYRRRSRSHSPRRRDDRRY